MSLLQALDRAIQRAFDALVFFLMRTFGVKKSLIRYALTGLQILSIVGMALAAWRVPSYRSSIVFYGLWIPLLFLQQRREFRNDQEAEHRGMLSKTDAQDAGGIGQLMKLLLGSYFIWGILQLLGLVPMPQMTGPPEEAAVALLWLKPRMFMNRLFELALLGTLYLARTPPTPPPKEEKVPVLAPSGSSS